MKYKVGDFVKIIQSEKESYGLINDVYPISRIERNGDDPLYVIQTEIDACAMFEHEIIEKVSSDKPAHPSETLTKREHFAALALQGLLARGAYASNAAKEAVLFADELINELNKEK